MAAIVYLATNRINGKRYVGVTSKRLRWRRAQHEYEALKGKAGCRRFHAAIRKYGPEAFDWTQLFSSEVYDDALAKEVEMIRDLRPEYNIALGGRTNKGFKHSIEFKAQKSEAMSGRKLTAEHRARIGASQIGRVVSADTGKRISAAKKGKTFTAAHRSALSAARQRFLAEGA